MIVSLLVAMDEKGGIGLEQALPWRLSSDLRRFRQLTMGHHIIMGRKTFETIGRVLPGRISIILTRNPAYRHEGTRVAASLEEALETARRNCETEAFIIGGAEIFQLALPLAHRIYLTRVLAVTPADTYFPVFDETQWQEEYQEYHPADEQNQYPYIYKILKKLPVP